jgi:mRNA interferase MazF
MYKRGTLILVPFPFTDLSGSKVRPALIISRGKIGQNIMVLFITSKNKSKEKHLVSIIPDSENGLKIKSNIVCGKIATLDTKVVLGELGTISDSLQNQVNKELKTVLNL